MHEDQIDVTPEQSILAQRLADHALAQRLTRVSLAPQARNTVTAAVTAPDSSKAAVTFATLGAKPAERPTATSTSAEIFARRQLDMARARASATQQSAPSRMTADQLYEQRRQAVAGPRRRC